MKTKIRRLKIVEQIIVVIVIAVLIPLSIGAAVITNINQQAVRKELRASAILSANSVQRYFENKFEAKIDLARNIAILSHYPYYRDKMSSYLKKVKLEDPEINSIEIVYKRPSLVKTDRFYRIFYNSKDETINIIHKAGKRKYVEIKLDAQKVEQNSIKDFADIQRQIYILDAEDNVIIPIDYNAFYVKHLLLRAPKNITEGEAKLFYSEKNQPNVIIKINDIGWKIIVATPKALTKYGITKARYKIISIILVTAGAIIFLCLIYSLSLYTNIRQLFKTINAVAEGNYNRKIRLITNFTTPYELIFLSKEFNKMLRRIKYSYRELKKSNKKLKDLDSFKSNLIDTVSHEFRTPLTSIKGYTSRLLRQDVEIDEQMRQDSLKIIKRQTERLSRMVDDLLVVPDIETSALKVFPEEISVKTIIDNVILAMAHNQNREFKVDVPDNLTNAYADQDRVEQVITNLLENAIKYSEEESPIEIKARQQENVIQITINNKCNTIPKSKLEKLFDKFTRIEDSTTRTTRGTGLGLFIVKGLVEAMDGEISVTSNRNFKVKFTLPQAK